MSTNQFDARVRSDCASPSAHLPQSAELLGEFVLIGPRVDARLVAEIFAGISLELAAHPPGSPSDPATTVVIPTTRVEVHRRLDGILVIVLDGDPVCEVDPPRAGRPARLSMRPASVAA